jgi:hypothetical protein
VARTVGRVLPLRHDAFEAELAGMGEDGRAVAFDILIEPDAGAGAPLAIRPGKSLKPRWRRDWLGNRP